MLLLYLLLPLLVACGEYAEGPKGSAGHDGGGSVASGPKPHADGPAKPAVGPKANDAYPEGPKQTDQKGMAHRVQDQAPFCPANAFWNTCPPPRSCEPSCYNYYPSCVWNRCYRPRCTCYQGYYRQSNDRNAACVQWQQCYIWGGLTFEPRRPLEGRFDGRNPFRWWGEERGEERGRGRG